MIEDEIEDLGEIEAEGLKTIHYNNLVDRYFTKYYINKGTENEQYVFIHSNGYIYYKPESLCVGMDSITK
jgi:hypothetical protein